MAYERLHWVESETPLSADNMNNIEDGIEELQAQKVDKVSGKALSDNNYTSDEKTKLAGIEAGAEVNVQPDWDQSDSSADDYIKNKPGNATTSVAGFMSTTDKSKLDGIAAGAEVNQNAFSNVKVGSTTLSADSKTDTLNIGGGNHIVILPSADLDSLSIATDLDNASTSTAGLMSAADKTKLNTIATGAQVNPGVATTSANGLMSSSDKTKLNGIQTGATRTSVISHLVDNIVVGATGYKDVSDTFTSSSGEIRGVVGFKMENASSSGTNYHSVCVNSIYVAGKTLYASLYNPSGSAAKVRLTAYIIKDV